MKGSRSASRRARISTLLFLLCLMGILPTRGSCEETTPPALTVFVAASLTDAAQALSDAYHEMTGQAVRLNPAASGTLARQIESGAPADVFLSANPRWTTYLEDRDLLSPSRAIDIARNQLVFIAPNNATLPAIEFSREFDLAAVFAGRLAIGDPEYVPAGRYAKDALGHYGWWNALEERLLPGQNVRAVLMAVERDEVDLGIVYKTDALASDQVRIVAEVPADSHPPVRYMAACINGSPEAAQQFLHFLRSPQAREIFSTFGFAPPEHSASLPTDNE